MTLRLDLEDKEDKYFQNFMDGLKTESTKREYVKCYNRFLRFINADTVDLANVEKNIQDWLIDMKKQGTSYSCTD